jgi:hypothetical protein
MAEKCPGCGMTVADPSGHLAHGMAQNTPTPTFGGKSLDRVVKEAMEPQEPEVTPHNEQPTDKLTYDLDVQSSPEPTPEPTAKPKNKGGRPRKA